MTRKAADGLPPFERLYQSTLTEILAYLRRIAGTPAG